MPSLSFKKQFAPAVRAGLAVRAAGREPFLGEAVKLQTIRFSPRRQYKAGDQLHMFTGMRQAGCERLGVAVCRSVQSIAINPSAGAVELQKAGVRMPLFEDEIEELARADGFADAKAFFAFFNAEAECSGVVWLAGQLIKW
ncbi:MAG: hypothetical protein CGU29_01550 [Candidatus Dactylopiibacterium carminicum]|uniref:ASCH domain-containing protein n=1 Tax=Candidatus Dactylopiibacterium carminicum TaxID=857335 RepID=A0A272EYJ1_9RHOO|nr:hypothetical protein BGI27_01615 [Candidatus Dactylopiibacterium carminicum]PAS95155.1 MAG: hypothetical protein CGU29_01550 [Candidatus Dactylopiibacterium carminicum]PAT00608.1 MAG: hypothetical protein BSR46_01625 [Candidatus Dactylopiibacterium carminicum]